MGGEQTDELVKEIQRDLLSSGVDSSKVSDLTDQIRLFRDSDEDNRDLEKNLLKAGVDAELIQQLFNQDDVKMRVEESNSLLESIHSSIEDTVNATDESHLDCQPQGFYVNSPRVAKVEGFLDQGEKVHYMARGKTGIQGIPRLVVTDKRILAKVPEFFGDDERSIPYDAINGVDLETGVINQKLTLLVSGGTTPIHIRRPGKRECRELASFIREKVAEANQSHSTTQNADPTEQLKNLKELYDDGVISKKEYRTKRRKILDDI